MPQVWGGGKQRAGQLYTPGRNLETVRQHLRRGFYGGQAHDGTTWGVIDIAGCWRTAESEINKWITKDVAHVADGLTGTVRDLGGYQNWTRTPEDCLNIQDMGIIPDEDDDELEADNQSSSEEEGVEA